MKTGFKEPNAPKMEKPAPKNLNAAPWAHSNVPYDERTSCYVAAGTNYGGGFNQPIGHTGNPKKIGSTLPVGDVDTMSLYPNG